MNTPASRPPDPDNPHIPRQDGSRAVEMTFVSESRLELITRRDIFLYITMVFVWGSTYFFTAVALRDFSPMAVVFVRLTMAALILCVLVRIKRIPRPNRLTTLKLFVFGTCSVALPFTLLTIAQAHLPSALVSVLAATTPIFTFLIAGLVTRSEPVSASRAGGVVLAFVGVVFMHPPNNGGEWVWQLVAISAMLFWAIGNVTTRRYLSGVDPVLIAAGQVSTGALIAAPLAILEGDPIHNLGWGSTAALVELGLVASAFCYVLYFRSIQRFGSTATAFNTFLQPPVGLALGVGVLGESISSRQWVALGVLLAGLALFVGGAKLSSFRRRSP